MINACELRIGNWITSESAHGGSWEVMPSDIERIFFNEKHYSPIPLTEEWLLKFGFKKEKNLFFPPNDTPEYVYNDFNIINQEGYFATYNGGPNLISEVEIKSVHQLQNLYFALTEQELTTYVPAEAT